MYDVVQDAAGNHFKSRACDERECSKTGTYSDPQISQPSTVVLFYMGIID